MSVKVQEQTSSRERLMSVLPLKAGIRQSGGYVSLVPNSGHHQVRASMQGKPKRAGRCSN
jgi:hypothetical protein